MSEGTPPPRDTSSDDERTQADIAAGSAGRPTPASDEATLAAGARFGPYRIRRLLGAGGMGEVYEADHDDSGTRVALKLLAGQIAAEHRERFLREGRMAASISHPNSVYVYGTDEIDGVPVISMELVSGGTLRDKVLAEGPLPSNEAVDLTLQLLDGLQAAHERDVLHRDIKPANCFLTANGVPKIGDFGLSRSIDPGQDTRLTMAGAIVGTPSYASPEQLRDEHLDVRSDIYSLGATLYYLLTGRAPFEEGNLARLMSQILQEAPRSPREHEPAVPEGLARVILECLAKDPAQRPADYATLRARLEPFDSDTPVPAAWFPRIVAGFVDSWVVSTILYLPVFAVAAQSGFMAGFTGADTTGPPEALAMTADLMAVTAIVTFLTFLYLVVSEYVWGAGLGKAIVRLRLVAADGTRPTLPRVALRAAIFVLVPTSIYLPYWSGAADSATLMSVGSFVLNVALFATCRPGNGRAALHGLLSGTRVVVHTPQSRPVGLQFERTALEIPASAEQLGPFTVAAVLHRDDGETLVRGFDERLGRRVWIRRYHGEAATVPDSRRLLARPGRLRWIDGRRRGEAWDAYEEIPGQPVAAIREQVRWPLLRQWIIDLAREIEASVEYNEPLDVSVDRVWIGSDGRARLLDFDVTEATATARPLDGRDPQAVQRFLAEVTRAATHTDGSNPAVLLPARAHAVFDRLEAGGHATLTELIDAVDSIGADSAEIAATRRLLPILCAWGPVILFALPLVVLAYLDLSLTVRDPDAARMAAYVSRIATLREEGADPDQLEALERYTAGRFARRLRDMDRLQMQMFTVRAREVRLAHELAERYPDVSAWEREAEVAAPLREPIELRARRPTLWNTLQIGGVVGYVSIGPLAAIALLIGLVLPSGPLLRAFGIAIVGPDGRLAGRAQATRRVLAVWGPGALALLLLVTRFGTSYDTRSSFAYLLPTTMAAVLVVAVYAWGLVAAIRTPNAGPQDRLAGTRLVRR